MDFKASDDGRYLMILGLYSSILVELRLCFWLVVVSSQTFVAVASQTFVAVSIQIQKGPNSALKILVEMVILRGHDAY